MVVWSVYVDWNNDGDFSDPGEDITAFVSSIGWRRGRDHASDLTGRAVSLSFEIDLLRCVFCGYCVDACPKQALIMSRRHEMAFVTRAEAVVGIDELKQKGPIADEDLGYRPYY